MSLAAKLPYDHAFAGGFSGIGSQPLPADADALDYLSRVKAADGAGVEVGVAAAVDAFFADAKELGVFSSLKACCILAGARTLAGALVPVVGDAPTNLPVANGFTSGDYTRGGATPGLKGDGTSYLDSGRANNDDPQNDKHISVYSTETSGSGVTIGTPALEVGRSALFRSTGLSQLAFRVNADSAGFGGSNTSTGLMGASRNQASNFTARASQSDIIFSAASEAPSSSALLIYLEEPGSAFACDDRIAFYSIGTSLSLEDLDTAVTNLINRLKFALLVGENPSGLDPDTIDYIVRGYEAGGTLE